MPLSAESLHKALPQQPIRYHDCLDTTNAAALDWLREGGPNGALVVADEQLRGRGRQGRTWHTFPNTAIALSMVLHPPASALNRMTLLGAVAVTDVLNIYNTPQSGIKWPNDVLVQGRKICGILPESVWEGDRLKGVVLGIGVNIRVDFAGTVLEGQAISLEDVLQQPISRVDFVQHLVQRLNHWSGQINSPTLFETWRGRLLNIGKSITTISANGPITGIAEGVDADGALLLRTADGHLQRIIAGDIELA